jgi:hypothetical protein
LAPGWKGLPVTNTLAYSRTVVAGRSVLQHFDQVVADLRLHVAVLRLLDNLDDELAFNNNKTLKKIQTIRIFLKPSATTGFFVLFSSPPLLLDLSGPVLKNIADA